MEAPTTAAAPDPAGGPAVVAAPAPSVVRGAIPRRRVFRGAGSFLAGAPAAPGFCVHLFYVDRQPVLDAVTGAGFGWVKQQVPWAAIENAPGAYDWTEFDDVVDAVTAADLGLVVSVNRAPTFYRSAGDDGPPDDPAALRRFMEVVAARYAGRVQAYEVWNEANLAVEWGYGRIDAGAFVRLLQAGYDGVKAGDPGALVIAGALTPTGVNDWQLAADDVDFLRAMYAYDGGAVRRAFDALGAHPSGFNNPPDDDPGRSTRPPGEDRFKGHWSFYFRRVEQLRQVMVEHGDGDKQIWLTEFGWASSANPAPGYEYAVDISEEDQAAYLVRAYQLARDRYPWIGTMAVWNLNFQALVPEHDEKWAFGLLRPDYSPRPAYAALAAMPK